VGSADDVVCVRGKRVRPLEQAVYLVLNKEVGYVTTMSDDHGRQTVADLVPMDAHPDIFPVGRLDKDTTGVLLFTNDGTLAFDLLHPSHHVAKTYIAEVRGQFKKGDVQVLERGVTLRNGYRAAPAKVQVLKAAKERSSVRITICEGKKRQIKMMCNAVHHSVLTLDRESFGPLRVDDLDRGDWRYLTAAEVAALKAAAQ
jgi:23S rRNA pseudouridine2605 synthase